MIAVYTIAFILVLGNLEILKLFQPHQSVEVKILTVSEIAITIPYLIYLVNFVINNLG